MSDTTYRVKGMTSVGCVNELAGAFHRSVIQAEVNLRAGTVTLAGTTPRRRGQTTVEGAGFQFAGGRKPVEE